MAKPLLVIGNKNYSSWSLRPFMALAQADIPFDEKLVRFGEPAFSKAVHRVSKAGLVPVLKHNGLVIWDTLAILEYIAETWPQKNLMPKSKAARAHARSICAEMHAGFAGLRSACPMNIRRPPKPAPVPLSKTVQKDIARIEQIWTDTRKTFGKGGPFLFGKFTIADAMYAPVASRMETFEIKLNKVATAYVQDLLNSKAYQVWKEAALKEPWIYAEDEVD